MNLKLLKDLCEINGTSSDEDFVRNFIIENIKNYTEDIKIDNLGNLIVFKKGKNRSVNKVVFSAHMDEVGFMVTRIDEDGFIYIESIGVSANLLPGKTVVIHGTSKDGNAEKIVGIIGIVPIHKIEESERGLTPKMNKIYIDIGAKSKKEAEKFVDLGDFVYFNSNFGQIGDLLKSKAIDDRFGCCVMIEMIKKDAEYDAYYVFTVQEEVGCRGAVAAANSLNPDFCVVLESTTAADIAGVEEQDLVCHVGNGGVISIIDKAAIYDKKIVDKVVEMADNEGISWQYKVYLSGGNDSSAFQKTAGGSKVLAISLPVRYLHSSGCVASENDMESILRLAMKINENIDLL